MMIINYKTFGVVKSYAYSTGAGSVCKTELIKYVKMKKLNAVIQ